MKKQADKRYWHESQHAASRHLYLPIPITYPVHPAYKRFCIYWFNLPISLFTSQAIPIATRHAFTLHNMLRQPNCVHQKAPENKSPMLLSIPNALATIPFTSFT